MKVHILAFSTHPDDIEIHCGGILFNNSNNLNVIVDVTKGNFSSNGTIFQREKESVEAAKLLKVKLRISLNLNDGGINPFSKIQRRKVIDILRKYRPTIVLLPYYQDEHIDHINASLLIKNALLLAGQSSFITNYKAYICKIVLYYGTEFIKNPNLYIDISEAIDFKFSALSKYKSQFMHTSNSLPSNLNSNYLKVIKNYNYIAGKKIGVKYAETLLYENVFTAKTFFDIYFNI